MSFQTQTGQCCRRPRATEGGQTNGRPLLLRCDEMNVDDLSPAVADQQPLFVSGRAAKAKYRRLIL